MSTPNSVVIQVVVRNGERYIRRCLDAVLRQTHRPIELYVLDNASTDTTAAIVAHEYPDAHLIQSDTNHGMWPGQELLLSLTSSEFVCALSVDVIIADDFVAQCVRSSMQDPAIGAIQGKLFQYTVDDLLNDTREALPKLVIDTCGFSLSRARTVVNIGHGQSDSQALQHACDIFGVEGAVPFFRRSALQSCRVGKRIWDVDYFWYGDDLDLAWRMTLFGFRQVFEPTAIAWHDRSTTKGSAKVPIIDHVRRRSIRSRIPLQKRRLDWSNTRFTIIKNEYIINFLRDAPYILLREMGVLLYTILFEPAVLLELPRFIRLLPRMISQRKEVQRRAIVSADALYSWFHT